MSRELFNIEAIDGKWHIWSSIRKSLNKKRSRIIEPKKTGNKTPIIITVVITLAVCIAVVAVNYTRGRGPYTDEIAAIANASVGDIVYFGSYEQDNDPENGTEPVAWYVLEKADGEATLLAVYLLDCRQYNEEWEDITWENCTLRSWLNSEFYNTAFSKQEQAFIVNINVVNEGNPYWDTEGGNDTTDKIWLLSLGEIEKYFHVDVNNYNVYWNGNMSREEYAIYCYGQDNRVCAKPTTYAAAKGVGTYSEERAQYEMDNYGYDMSYAIGSGWWWLRSPGGSSYAAFVNCGGFVGYDGGLVDDSSGVRPALKVAY